MRVPMMEQSACSILTCQCLALFQTQDFHNEVNFEKLLKNLNTFKNTFALIGAWAFGDHEHENDMKLRASLQSEELCPGQESDSL